VTCTCADTTTWSAGAVIAACACSASWIQTQQEVIAKHQRAHRLCDAFAARHATTPFRCPVSGEVARHSSQMQQSVQIQVVSGLVPSTRCLPICKAGPGASVQLAATGEPKHRTRANVDERSDRYADVCQKQSCRNDLANLVRYVGCVRCSCSSSIPAARHLNRRDCSMPSQRSIGVAYKANSYASCVMRLQVPMASAAGMPFWVPRATRPGNSTRTWLFKARKIHLGCTRHVL
jgi:hypothetical protein